ncbi:MAG: glucosaminidase domain-containing protein [Chitinophagaceae bacterium]|jgi:LysM repeat protein|nr:glucosaminidase domain-containing protein [Chitinophagaceae bacterium]
MKTKNIAFFIFSYLLSCAFPAFSQEAPNENIIKYIEQYAALAVKEMERTGVPASIKIAQGIHETNAGKSDLVLQSNNHFGIKCKSTWTGEKVFHNDDAEGECFRKYEDAKASYLDHSNYLKSQPRYAFLFEYDANDYAAWAWGLKKAGYATNPIYAQTLIKYIEAYQLNELNDIAENKDEEELENFFEKIRNKPLQPLANNGKFIEPEDKENTVKKTAKEKKSGKRIKVKKTHVVKRGDSLYSLSKKYGTTVEALKKVNHLKKEALQVGQKIKIPKK